MSLIAFHRALILTAILFCLGYAWWELSAYLDGAAGTGAVALAAVFALLAIGLTGYLVRLSSILKLEE